MQERVDAACLILCLWERIVSAPTGKTRAHTVGTPSRFQIQI